MRKTARSAGAAAGRATGCRQRRPLRSMSLRRFNADGCFAASGALSYTALVSLVPLAAIALGSLSVFPIFAHVHDELLALMFRNFIPSIGEQAAWWFRQLRQFSRADNGDRHLRHCRYRRPAAGDGRGPAQPDLAGQRTAPVGAAHPRLLDLDHPGAAAARTQPVAVDLFRDRGEPDRLRRARGRPDRRAAGCTGWHARCRHCSNSPP